MGNYVHFRFSSSGKLTLLYFRCCCCSIVEMCSTVCDPMHYSTPGLPVHLNSRVLLLKDIFSHYPYFDIVKASSVKQCFLSLGTHQKGKTKALLPRSSYKTTLSLVRVGLQAQIFKNLLS